MRPIILFVGETITPEEAKKICEEAYEQGYNDGLRAAKPTFVPHEWTVTNGKDITTRMYDVKTTPYYTGTEITACSSEL